MKKRIPELLAPAGSPEMLLAALRCGADAVYLGLEAFNARTGAQNFSGGEAFAAAVHQCRLRQVRVYLTLNTMLTEAELPQALALAQEAAAAGVHALIVQDLGLMRQLQQRMPGMPVHASTQCSVQTAPGMALLQRLGASRCVIPRECSKAEIAALVQQAPLELEVFVHGAHCMSVSGQCLMSAVFGDGSRSGNKGSCAQPCRLPWRVRGAAAGEKAARGEEDALSLKDLSLLEEVTRPPLNQVASWKIEGRQKHPEYTAAAVTAFRSALDGLPSPIRGEELRNAFSRAGFTQGYYRGVRDAAMFGRRSKEDAASPALLRHLRRLYEKETPRMPLQLQFSGEIGRPSVLRATVRDLCAEVQGEPLQPARERAVSAEEVRRQLGKLGGTCYFAGAVLVHLPEGAFLPMGALNSMRRAVIAALEAQMRASGEPVQKAEHSAALPLHGEPVQKAGYSAGSPATYFDSAAAFPAAAASSAPTLPTVLLRFLSPAQVPAALPEEARVFLPCDTPAHLLHRCRAEVTVPAGIFGTGESVLAQLRQAREAGAQFAMAHTLDGMALALAATLIPIAGEGMNLCNSEALAAAHRLGAAMAVHSAEEAPARQAKSAVPLAVLVYGRMRLMLCRACPVRAQVGCAFCNEKGGVLLDRKGIRFPVRCENGCGVVYNSRPLWLADQPHSYSGAAARLFAFTTESREECDAVLQAYAAGSPCAGAFTRAWYRQRV